MGITAPEYGGQHVEQSGPSGARLNGEAPMAAFGGGGELERAGAATAAFGSEAGRVANAAWMQANQLKVLDADNQLNDFEAKTVYDPQNGALTKRGKDAFGVPEQVLDGYDKTANDIAAGLQNNAQRISFMHLANARRFMLQRVVGRHVDGEIKRYDDETTQAAVKNAQDMAISNYSDPDIVGEQIAKQKAILLDYGKRAGLPGKLGPDGELTDDKDNAALKMMVDKSVSATHAGIIKQFAENGLSESAQGWLKANGKFLQPGDLQASENLIRQRLPVDVASRIYKNNPPVLSDGSPDREAVKSMIDKDDNLDAEQKVMAFNSFEAFANHDEVALKRVNQSNTASFYSKITDMASKGASIDDQKKVADQLASKFQNGQIDENDRASKYVVIDQLAKPSKVTQDDIGTATELWHGLESGEIQDPDRVVKAHDASLISDATFKKMVGQLMNGTTVAVKNRWGDIAKRAIADFPDTNDRQQFLASLRSEWYEKPNANPDTIDELYKKRTENVDSGTSYFFGLYKPEVQSTEIAQQVRRNPAIVSAIGGTANAIKLAQDLGGPELLQPGKPYGDAILALRDAKKKITPETIKMFVKNNPEYKR